MTKPQHKLSDTRILIVGGAGFVGSNLARELIEYDVSEIVIVDNLLSADLSNVPRDDIVTFVQGSITDDRILSRIGVDFDYVFHLATLHGNQSSIHDPILDHDNNTLPTLKLCEHFKAAPRLCKMVYSSAGCTVAEKTFDVAEATTEESPVSLYLDSPYQLSKIFGEFYGNYYLKQHGLPFVKARFQNVYGPFEMLGAGRWRGTPATVWRNVIPTFIFKALHGLALPIENGGIATRDFIFVDDIVDGLLRCATLGENGGVYNLACGVETSILELANLINELTSNASGVAVQDARDWDRSGKRHGEISKSRDDIGFEAEVTLKSGLTDTISWTIENYESIKRAMEAHQFYCPEVNSYCRSQLTIESHNAEA